MGNKSSQPSVKTKPDEVNQLLQLLIEKDKGSFNDIEAKDEFIISKLHKHKNPYFLIIRNYAKRLQTLIDELGDDISCSEECEDVVLDGIENVSVELKKKKKYQLNKNGKVVYTFLLKHFAKHFFPPDELVDCFTEFMSNYDTTKPERKSRTFIATNVLLPMMDNGIEIIPENVADFAIQVADEQNMYDFLFAECFGLKLKAPIKKEGEKPIVENWTFRWTLFKEYIKYNMNGSFDYLCEELQPVIDKFLPDVKAIFKKGELQDAASGGGAQMSDEELEQSKKEWLARLIMEDEDYESREREEQEKDKGAAGGGGTMSGGKRHRRYRSNKKRTSKKKLKMYSKRRSKTTKRRKRKST